MKHVVLKYFTFGAYEREEQWLNHMAAQGHMLTGIYAICYEFEDGVPGEYTYRIELLDNALSHPESARYLRFLEETGVECVGSFRRWVYLRKKAVDGEFQLYSDIDSKIRHYKRVTHIANIITIVMACSTAMLLCEAFSQYAGYIDWYRRGFSCKPYHVPYLVWSGALVLFAIFVQMVVLRVRMSLHRLKKERTIRE